MGTTYALKAEKVSLDLNPTMDGTGPPGLRRDKKKSRNPAVAAAVAPRAFSRPKPPVHSGLHSFSLSGGKGANGSGKVGCELQAAAVCRLQPSNHGDRRLPFHLGEAVRPTRLWVILTSDVQANRITKIHDDC